MSETEETIVDTKEEASSDVAHNQQPILAEDAPEAAKKSVRIADTSSALIEESRRLFDSKSCVSNTSHMSSPVPLYKSCSASSDNGDSYPLSLPRYSAPTPRFKRIDFDDRLEDLYGDRKPAWKTWQESIKDSYHKAKRSVERNKDETAFLETTLNRTRISRAESPFRHLSTDTGFIPSIRSRNSLMMPSLSDRSRLASSSSSLGHAVASGSGPYIAPAVTASQGIESRYERRANDVEAMLLKTAPLPTHMKTITAKEFRNASPSSVGLASEKDDYDFSMYCPRPYYSRPNRDDPDYFDFDLQHSVDLFKRPEGKYTPRGPQEWETKLLGDAEAKGSTPLSGYMFTKVNVYSKYTSFLHMKYTYIYTYISIF
uniref:Uncharacterized protein n=1 Tax=Heterorhabditis bacteriophora TaxID=37862 RepID=A0A1I7XQX8_HETBA